MQGSVQGLIAEYNDINSNIHDQIEERLNEFRSIWSDGTSDDILVELLFCILTPQSNAHMCWKIVQELRDEGVIFTIGEKDLATRLERGARFKNRKAHYFIEARDLFKGGLDIRGHLSGFTDACGAREWIVENIKWIGYKEASHFLRNIGWGSDIAILDRHILKNLELCGVLDGPVKNLNPIRYCEIERKVVAFSRGIGVSMEHLDLVMWYKEKDEIFK